MFTQEEVDARDQQFLGVIQDLRRQLKEAQHALVWRVNRCNKLRNERDSYLFKIEKHQEKLLRDVPLIPVRLD